MESLKQIEDVNGREKMIFAPLVIGTLLLGVYPSLITDVFGPSVEALLDQVEAAREATELAMK